MTAAAQPATITIFFATISSLAALCSIYLTYRGQRLQRRGANYQLAVADPIHEYLRQFVDEMLRLLSTGLGELDRISREDGRHSEMTAQVDRLFNEVDERWRSLKWRVVAGVSAWKDAELERGVHRVLQDLEDAIKQGVADRVAGTRATRQFIAGIRGDLEVHATRMLQLVIEHDPALRKARWLGLRRPAARAALPPARAGALGAAGQ